MVQHGDQIQWAKNPREGSQPEITRYHESKDVMQVAEGTKDRGQTLMIGLDHMGIQDLINHQNE